MPIFFPPHCRCPVSLESRSKCCGRFSRTICWFLVLRGTLGQMLVVGPKCHTAVAPRNSIFSTRSRIPEAPNNTTTTALVNYFMPKTNVGAKTPGLFVRGLRCGLKLSFSTSELIGARRRLLPHKGPCLSVQKLEEEGQLSCTSTRHSPGTLSVTLPP